MSPVAQDSNTLDAWVARDAIEFQLDSQEGLQDSWPTASPTSFPAAVDKMLSQAGSSLEVLALGEPMHGSEEFLLLRNRLFQRLVEAHGYTAIAIESSFPRAHLVNEYVAGRGAASYEEIQDSGFSHQFGKPAANRALVEWMRQYNADPAHSAKLRFYGFDSPTEMMGTDSPRQMLQFVLDYFDSVASPNSEAQRQARRQRIEELLGPNAPWENSAAMFNPAESIGNSPAAVALRLETEDLLSEFSIRRPELEAHGGQERFLEARQYAKGARQLLTYHASVARPSSQRTVELLGIRDATMADNLAYMAARERGRDAGGGKLFVQAHNSHLKLGRAQWQWGPNFLEWWPAGAQLRAKLGVRYAVIGAGVGIAEAQGIGPPDVGSLEEKLSAATTAQALFIPTHLGEGLSKEEIAALPTRIGSAMNSTYFPLNSQSFTDFDWLMMVR